VNELSRRTGITLSVLQAIVNGISTPRPSTLRTLSEFFGVSTKVLVSDLSGTDIGVTSFQSTSDVLKFLIDDVCVSERELERLTGVSQQLINNIIHGNTKHPKDATLAPLAEFFGVSVAQLRAEEALDRYREKGKFNEVAAAKNKIKIMPWNYLKLLPESLDAEGDGHLFSKFCGNGIYASCVQGPCPMEPFIRPGDTLIVDYAAPFEKARTFLVQTVDSAIVVGDYLKNRSKEVLVFAGSTREPMELKRGTYRKLGMVLEVRKSD
jgi:transcriptional regulator with XRE-family HTH domain